MQQIADGIANKLHLINININMIRNINTVQLLVKHRFHAIVRCDTLVPFICFCIVVLHSKLIWRVDLIRSFLRPQRIRNVYLYSFSAIDYISYVIAAFVPLANPR